MFQKNVYSIALLATICLPSISAWGQQPEERSAADSAYLKILNQGQDNDSYTVMPADDSLTVLHKQRINAGLAALASIRQRIMEGAESIIVFGDVQQRVIQAQLDFHDTDDEKLLVLEKALQSARGVEDLKKMRMDAGLGRPGDAALASMNRLEIEIQIKTLQRNKASQDK